MVFQSPMDFMSTEPERILTPYLGRRVYGGLVLEPHSPTEKEKAAGMEKPGFGLLHSGVTGNDYNGMLLYQLGSGEYMVVDPFDKIRLITPNSEDVLAFLQALPQLIRKQREADKAKEDYERIKKEVDTIQSEIEHLGSERQNKENQLKMLQQKLEKERKDKK